jgi:hypothetical protein
MVGRVSCGPASVSACMMSGARFLALNSFPTSSSVM